MSYRPDEKDWMAYLYGELEEAEKQKFEQYLLQHPEAEQELKNLQNIRKLLAQAEDKEVISPPIFIDHPSGTKKERHLYFWNSHAFRVISAVAASVIVIILAGKFADARLSISDHEFRLTFGDTPVQDPVAEPLVTALSPQEVQNMINVSLERNNSVMQASLEDTQKDLEASLRKNLAANSGRVRDLVSQEYDATQEQIRQYVESMRAENIAQMKDYFQLTSTEQKKYMENFLVDFAKYWQQQRNNDLQLIQTRMSSLEQDTDLFRQETEQIFSSIIPQLGAPVSNEVKY